ncbi:hypothetical protein U14_02972 [Candidatus Moduliflexus flocculans]|uniref:DUF2281 domain-containing protein n=1 Tax=Candidatus Moduliflexus flocculans TaxID=1499966 RepID=A0A081BMW1_9BACT|nr:hypothetical protein U14_02972 [Candidatus Moduliflexus flocculans]
MELSTLQAYEDAIVTIMRRLPGERQRELFDFAQFLESRTTDKAKSSEHDAKWEQLLAKPESSQVLENMVREAREEYRTGHITAITITDDGRLSPA